MAQRSADLFGSAQEVARRYEKRYVPGQRSYLAEVQPERWALRGHRQQRPSPALRWAAREIRMRRTAIVLAATFGLCVAYVVAHWALIELGREVIVLRTEKPDGEWLETRLWIVDDGGYSWLHGADSDWMRNLRARPIVEVERGGETRRYRAHAVPGPHPKLHELLRAKYGVADRWVRLVGPDSESTMAVRLELLR